MIIDRLNGSFLRLSRCLFNNKNENDEKVIDVIVMNPYDSIIQNITSNEEG